MSQRQSGGDLVARTLTGLGVETVYTVSGNQILPIFDAAHDARLRMVHMRHETAAVYAAIGAAELHDRASVALVSAGPGFLASLQGVGVARSMELPILLLAGAAPVSQRQRGAFQDIDQPAIAAPICKGAFEPASVETLAATIREAHALATSGVPGPVLISLPADLLAGTTASARRPQPQPLQPTALDDETATTLDAMAARLQTSLRPAVVARPSAARSEWLAMLASTLGVRPLITESPRGLSDSRYADAFAQLRYSDCILVVAAADFATGFLSAAQMGALDNVLLIDDASDPVPLHPPVLRCHVAPQAALRRLAERLQPRTAIAAEWSDALAVKPPPSSPANDPAAGLHPLALSAALRASLRPDDIVVLDGGEFCQWMRLGLRDIENRMLWNGKLGAIGGSLPMALGAAITAPDRRIVAVLGDGSAGYFLSEFETLSRYGLKITALIGNDALWAAEWHMQAARYGPDRTFDTELTPARYDLAAQGFGGHGFNVLTRDELAPALEAALATPTSSCVNIRVAPVRSPAEVLH